MKQLIKITITLVVMFALVPCVIGQVTPIYDIQYTTDVGSGSDCYPSLLDSSIVTVSGIVTAVVPGSYPNFYLQDGDGPWDGIFVYDTSVQPAQGDSVTFDATVDEYYGLSELKNVSSSTIHSSGHTLYNAISASTGDIGGGCSIDGEPYEGLLVQLTNVTVTQEADPYGQWFVDDGTGECEIEDSFFDFEPTVGDFYDAIIGVVSYGYGEYEVIPRSADDLITTAIGPTLVDMTFTPTFPAPNEDVDVTVTAYDDKPGLVIDLYISVDGGTYTSSPMTDNGDSTYSGIVPGQPEWSTSDFYALLTDSDNNTVTSDTFRVTYFTLAEVIPIDSVQYTDDPSGDSPLNGQQVTISGVVTAEFWGSSDNRYLFVQDAETPWSGIMVFEYGGWDSFDFISSDGIVHSVAEGEQVIVTGTVDEYYGKTEITDVTQVLILGPARDVIEPIDVTPGQIMTGGSDAEAYEGVLVRVTDVIVDDEDLGNGEWSVTDGQNSVRVDDIWDYYYWPEEDAELESVTGCLDYSYGNFKIQPRLARDVVEEGIVRLQRIQQVLYSDLIKAGEDATSDISYMYGDTVTIEGIVTMPTGLSYAGAGVKFIYEDEHGGPWSAILSYDPDSTAFPVLFEGDKVRATGYIYEYNTAVSNMTELFITQPVQIIDFGVDLPPVDTVATGDLRWPTEAEQWGTVMVAVKDVVVTQDQLQYEMFAVDDGTGEVRVDDDSDSIQVWFDTTGAPPIGTLLESIRGWVYHHYGAYSDSSAYKLEPLYVSDIVFGAGPPSFQDVGRVPCVPGPDDTVTVSCEISDNSTVVDAEIFYSIDGGAYQSTAMINTSGMVWEGTIPATGIEGGTVDYYIEATDDGAGQGGVETSTYPSNITQLQLGYVTKSGDLTIVDIQYTQWPIGDSRFNECEVTVTGIVTADTAQYYSGYGAYTMQTATGPWNGIIFDAVEVSQPLLTRGDEVTITGTVEEYDLEWHFKYDNNTKIINVSTVTINSLGNTIIAQPVATADLAQDAEEVESYEGCLVTLSNVTVTSLNQYDWSVEDESGVSCLIDDDMATSEAGEFLGALEVGTQLAQVAGIFNFSFGTYKIQVRDMGDFEEALIVSQVIPLTTGWNIFSTYVTPDDLDMLSVVQPLIDADALDKVIDEAGNTVLFFFGEWVNNIGNLANTEGYYIKVNDDVNLTIEGTAVELPFEIDLTAGWNIMGYPTDTAQDALTVVQPLIDADELDKVLDEAGNAILYFFGNWVNNIGDFEAGEGYYVKVSTTTSLTISAPALASSNEDEDAQSSRIRTRSLDNSHFTPIWSGNPFKRMAFWMIGENFADIDLEAGDEVAVFDGDLCVGTAGGTGEQSISNPLIIHAGMDDGCGNGFEEGDVITFRILDASESSEAVVTAVTYMDPGTGNEVDNPTFESLSDYAIILVTHSEFMEVQDELGLPETFALNQNYPNPFNPVTTIKYDLPEQSYVTIVIYDMLGRNVKTLVNRQQQPGYKSITWNSTDEFGNPVGAGVYLYRIKASNFTQTRKMVLIR